MPPSTDYPGVYVEELPAGTRSITGGETATCVFVGRTARAPLPTQVPQALYSFGDFERHFGGWQPGLSLPHAVHAFFENGGGHALIVRVHAGPAAGQAGTDGGPPLADADYLGDAGAGTGLHALRQIGAFNLLCIPPDTPEGDTTPVVYQAALGHCVELRALLLVDPPVAWQQPGDITRNGAAALAALGLAGAAARNAALYFPRLLQQASADAAPVLRVPCGAVAGVMARTDATRGVWKAPAGAEADLRGALTPAVTISDAQNGELNRIGVNALRVFPRSGTVIWGARTLGGADAMADDYKYVPVRRLALHIEHSLVHGTQWVVFEPNAEPLWAQLRLAVGAFMQTLFRQGALQGRTPSEAYYVKCGADTTTSQAIEQGRCTVVVGFAPLKPAEFLELRIELRAGPSHG